MASDRQRAARRCMLLAISLLSLAILAGCSQEAKDAGSTPEPLRVQEYRNEAALDLLYPADWGEVLVSQGLLLFGEEKVLSIQEPGASLTVYRQEFTDPDLGQIFQHYLDSGPLASGYQLASAVQPARVGQREALEVSVEAGAVGEAPAMKSYIIAARTESGVTYILTASAPQAEWEQNWPKFQVVIGSVEFNE